MRSLTLNEKRVVAAVYLGTLLFAAGNHYLQWGLVGDFDKQLLAAVGFVGAIALARFGPALQREMLERQAAQRKAEQESEEVRDKSNDGTEAKRIGRAIGMSSNRSPDQGKNGR